MKEQARVPAHRPWSVAGVSAAIGVLAQIAHPLLSGGALRAATIVSVLFLAAAAVVHAGTDQGRRGAATVLTVAGGLGLAVETLGVHTGFPFGGYTYADSLGPRLLGVPVLVPLAWTMLAYPSLLLGRRLAVPLARHLTSHLPPHLGPGRVSTRVLTAATGGLTLAAWDLFLDPQMVAEGHWSWTDPAPGLPGVPGVPLTNYAGWLLVSLVMIATLDRFFPASPRAARTVPVPPAGEPVPPAGEPVPPAGEPVPPVREPVPPARELVPAAVLTWTWAGSAVGNLVFFDRPWVALYGGLVMGVLVVPYLRLLLEQPRGGFTAPRAEPVPDRRGRA